MTLNFYQVNRSLSSFNSNVFKPSNFNYLYHLKESAALNLSNSSFVLFPYINPKFPYPTSPSSLEPRHLRQQATYNDLKQLNAEQVTEFLLSYQAFRHPIFGRKNPTNITNLFYQWVIKHDLDAWSIGKMIIDNYDYDDSFETLPLWCQARMGQSRTVLPDGRIILIGGEYEDYYDPDFCIYNDVIVMHPNGNIDVYNYSKAVFTPTDFHSATLVGIGSDAHIIIIGSLGCLEDRQYAHTPVYKLNTQNFKIEQVATRNSMGWIHDHKAVLKDNQMIITGGQLLIDDIAPLLDNIDTWVLNLNTLVWKNVTQRYQKWQRFYVRRQDGIGLLLWYYKQLDEYLQTDTKNKPQKNVDYIQKQIKEYSTDIEKYTNKAPNIDIYRQLLIPPLEHKTYVIKELDDSDYDHILYIDEIKVGYKTKEDSCIQVIIEGKLSEDKLELLQQNLRHKLSKVENMACEVVEL